MEGLPPTAGGWALYPQARGRRARSSQRLAEGAGGGRREEGGKRERREGEGASLPCAAAPESAI